MVDTQKKYIQIISDLVSIPKDELTEMLKKDLRKKKATPLMEEIMSELGVSEEELREQLKYEFTGKITVHIPEEEIRSPIAKMLSKLIRIMNDIYILKTGDVISLDVDYPYHIKLQQGMTDSIFSLLPEIDGIIHIPNAREFKMLLYPSDKEAMNDGFDFYEYKTKAVPVILNSEKGKVLARLKYYQDLNADCDNWYDFVLDESTINKIFVNNDYFDFIPEGVEDGPSIILTKESFPLITEKTADIIEYSARQYSKDLYLIVFRFDCGIFSVQSFNFYIPMVRKDS